MSGPLITAQRRLPAVKRQTAAMDLAVAVARSTGYLSGMDSGFGRGLVALIIVALLSLGSVVHGAMAADMAPSIAVASAAALAPHDCDACGGDEAMSGVVCYGVCTSSAAVLSDMAPVKIGLAGLSSARIAASQTSWRAAPDPYPPRSVVLS